MENITAKKVEKDGGQRVDGLLVKRLNIYGTLQRRGINGAAGYDLS